MTTTWPERLIEAGALFLLVFTPLAFGTVQPWSEAIAEIVVLGMAVTYVIGNLKNWELRIELPPGWLPALGFLLLIVLQAVVPGWSLDPHATWREALKLLAVAAFFFICWNTYHTRAQAERALWTMIGVGTFIAIFGIVQRMTWTGRLYWIGPEVPASAFGPFVNRTHFAGLMVVVVPAALAFMLATSRTPSQRRTGRSTWPDRFREWNSTESTAVALIPLLILVMGSATLVSGSRGGVVAFLFVLISMILSSLAAEQVHRAWVARLALASMLIILTGIWIGGDIVWGTAERLADELERPEESLRLQLWIDAIGLWRETPILGSGLASFAVAFPRHRTIQAPVVFGHAESDPVQLITDSGLLGLALSMTAILLAIGFHRPAMRFRTQRQVFELACLVALVGSVLQGLANYNLSVMSGLIYIGGLIALGRPVREAVR